MRTRLPLAAGLILVLAAALSPSTLLAQGFGGAVAASGGDVFAGYVAATGESGVVKVYNRRGETWLQVGELRAADATGSDDRFGRALAAHGNYLFAGATTRDNSRGGVYVFERGNDGWQQTALLLPAENQENDSFGRSVATNGTVLLAGAAGKDGLSGAAYSFVRDASGNWVEQSVLRPDGLQPNDLFGLTVALDGQLALISAIKQGTAPGDVYAYRYDAGAGAWNLLGRLPTPDVSNQSGFGLTIAIRGNNALVGAPGQGNGEVHAYRFNAASGSWQHEGRIAPEGSAGFGMTVFMNEDGAFIGSAGDDDGAGAIYPYRYDTTEMAWVPGDRIEATGRMSNLGGAIHVAGNTGVFGMPGADFGLGRIAIMRYDADGLGWVLEAEFYDEVERLASVVGEEVACEGGSAAGFNCDKVDLLSFMSLPDIGGDRGIRVNDVWGWTDPTTDKEYALVGRMDGTSFVDISDPYNPIYLGNLPKTEGSQSNSWRDIKVYNDHAFIVADGAGEHGMQVFDLRQLRDVTNPPMTFQETGRYDGIHSAHNIVINEDTGFAYTVGNSSGGETCGGGSHMIDIRDPANPKFAGCFAHEATGRTGTGYTHDAQCVVYHGPDEDYAGREICFGSNETALSIADVTDKDNPVAITAATYPNVGYAHQGWLTEDHRYFLLDDELDELQGLSDGTRTLIWDLEDLDDPQLIKEYVSENKSSDHNLYIKGNYVYQSNYVSGLRILDITDINNPVEVAHFDTVPGETNDPGFDGSWSNYPFFKSGVIVVTSGAEGLFLVRKNEKAL